VEEHRTPSKPLTDRRCFARPVRGRSRQHPKDFRAKSSHPTSSGGAQVRRVHRRLARQRPCQRCSSMAGSRDQGGKSPRHGTRDIRTTAPATRHTSRPRGRLQWRATLGPPDELANRPLTHQKLTSRYDSNQHTGEFEEKHGQFRMAVFAFG